MTQTKQIIKPMKECVLKVPKRVVLALVAILLPLCSYPQTFANGRIYTAKQTTSSTIKLRDAVLQIKGWYNINIVFEESLLEGKTVNDSVLNRLPDFEKVLSAVLQPSGLDFKKVKKNAYLIVSSSPLTKDLSELARLPLAVQGQDLSSVFLVSTAPESALTALQVSGTVKDEAGIALPGVNILEKGTTNGTTTDANGNFKFSVEDTNSVLVFSFIGYASKEVTVGSTTQFDISLEPDMKSLEEVVVVAYGTKSKKDLTGAVSAINADEIVKSTSLTPQMAMRGTMPGVFVSAQGGDPNSKPTVRIRGVTTFSGKSAEPLYVIDGVMVRPYGDNSTFNNAQKIDDIKGTQNIFNLINPSDIESISVLKDASSAAAYGALAANGVVLITTKKGKDGKAKIDFRAQTGITNLSNGKIDVMNTPQYVEYVNRSYAGDPAFNDPEFDIYKEGSSSYLGNSPTYDWQDAIINKNGKIEEYNLSVSGGTAKATYYLSGGYARQESNVKFNDQKRYSLSTSMDFKPTEYFEIGQNFRLAFTDQHDDRDNTGVPISMANAAFRNAPWMPIYNENGYGGYQQIANENQFGTLGQNYLAVGDFSETKYYTYKTLGNVYARLKPVKNLSITGTIGVDYYTTNRDAYQLGEVQLFLGNSATPGPNRYQQIKGSNLNLTKRLAAEYAFFIGEHNFNLYGHAESVQFKYQSLDATSTPSGVSDPYLFLIDSEGTPASYKEDNALIGYVGRLSYKYKDKYYIDGTFLRQGSSKFGPDNRWGIFPSVSAAWRLTSESFMESVTFVNDLKIKAGIGQLGNDDVVGWQYLSLVENRYQSYLTGNNVVTVGSTFSNFPTRDIGWEKVTTINFGFESTLFEKINFSAEYYKRITDDILQSYSLPGTAGVTPTPFRNIGSCTNTGIELVLGYSDNVGEFNYGIDFNITTVKNRVTKLSGGVPSGSAVLGYPIGSIYGFKSDGVIKTQEQLDAYKITYASSEYVNLLQLGDLMYEDIGGERELPSEFNNGVPDGVIDGNDGSAYLGKTIPGYFYGVSLRADYKGVDLSVQLQGVGDVMRVNSLKQEGLYPTGTNNRLTELLDSWTPENSDSNLPRLVSTGGSLANNGRFSDRFVENGSFLRVANVQLGYRLPSSVMEKTKVLSSARIFVSGSNLLTFTKYTGYDPENDFIPPARIIMAGINFGL